MYGNILMVFGGSEQWPRARAVLTADGCALLQRENVFYFQTQTGEASFALVKALRQANLRFNLIYINNPSGSFVRDEDPARPDIQAVKKALGMNL